MIFVIDETNEMNSKYQTIGVHFFVKSIFTVFFDIAYTFLQTLRRTLYAEILKWLYKGRIDIFINSVNRQNNAYMLK